MLSMQMHSPLIMAWTLGLLVAEPMTQIACLNPTVVNTTMNSSLTFVSRIIDQPDSGWISKSLLEKNLFLFYYFHFFLNWDACIMYMCIKLLTCICSCILVRRYTYGNNRYIFKRSIWSTYTLFWTNVDVHIQILW